MASAALWRRVGAVSGCSAVALGAYGEHGMPHIDHMDRDTFKVGQRYHLLHSALFLAVPFARRPAVVGTLLAAGIVGFCGSLYTTGYTQDRRFAKMAPVGGTILMLSWLSFGL